MLLWLSVVMALAGCGESSVMYYRLQSRPLAQPASAPLCGSVRIKPFTIASAYETEYILTTDSTNAINTHYYDRWIQEPHELVTDFFIDNFQTRRLFCEITDQTSSALQADYALEGRVLDMLGSDNGNIQFRLALSLTTNALIADEPKVLLHKVYSASAPRWTNENFASLASAMEQAVAAIADSVAVDIRRTCNNETLVRRTSCEGCMNAAQDASERPIR